MENMNKETKLYKRLKFDRVGVVAIVSLLMVLLLGAVAGCSNPITGVETEVMSYSLRQQNEVKEQFWFVKLFNEQDSRRNSSYSLEAYLQEHGDRLDIKALAEFIEKNIGKLTIFLGGELTEEFMNFSHRGSQTFEIPLEDGSVVTVTLYEN